MSVIAYILKVGPVAIERIVHEKADDGFMLNPCRARESNRSVFMHVRHRNADGSQNLRLMGQSLRSLGMAKYAC